MIDSIYSFESYTAYLAHYIRHAPKKGRGLRTALAQAAKCQPAYITRVLQGGGDLSLEQGERVSRLLAHSAEESHYFLLLIQQARAGTPALRDYFRAQLEDLRQKQAQLAERFKVKTALDQNAQAIYYSSWVYGAVHLAVGIPRLTDRDAIARELILEPERVADALEFLLSVGLIRREAGRYAVGEARMHVGHDSPFVTKHHINWRLQAMQALERTGRDRRDRDLHYSSTVTISGADQRALREHLIQSIERYNAIIAPSPEEELHCLTLDFFKV